MNMRIRGDLIGGLISGLIGAASLALALTMPTIARADVGQEAGMQTGPGPGSTAKGKRAAPPEVAPVKIGNIQYEVLHWGKMHNLPQNGGYLMARDAAGKTLWIEQIYKQQTDPALESDVQQVFLVSLRVARDKKTLELKDERGRNFRFDPAQRRVLP